LMEVLTWGYLGIFVVSWLIYLVPFLPPSTMLFAGAIAATMPYYHPALVGVAVSAGCALAKAVQYYVTYFAGEALSAETKHRLQGYSQKIAGWQSVAAFVASASPIPDEPVLISLALVKYSPIRFFLSFFLGKLVVTVPGAYMQRAVVLQLSKLVGKIPAAVASIIFTIVATVIFVKVDLDKLWRRLIRKNV